MKRILVLLSLLTTAMVHASGKVDFLEVDKGIVSFSTVEAKTATSPACVASETANLWTVTLASETGRATYTMLMTALSTGVPVKVESAGDCAYMAGLERASRVWFENE